MGRPLQLPGPVDNLERSYLARLGELTATEGVRAVSVGAALPPDGAKAVGGWWTPQGELPSLVVLPNPWGERDAIGPMDVWCWDVVGRVIDHLAGALSERHGITDDRRYWSLLLAPWLVHLVSAVADRRLFLRAAAVAAPGQPVWGVALDDPPATMSEAVGRLRSVHGNAELLTRMAPLLDLRVTEAPLVAEPHEPVPVGSREALLGAALREPVRASKLVLDRAASAGLGWLSVRGARSDAVTILGQSGLRAQEKLALSRRAGPLRLPTHHAAVAIPGAVDDAQRARLGQSATVLADDLERMVLALMPGVLPRSLFEGFHAVRAASQEAYDAPSPVVVAAYGADEVSNEFLARCAVAGEPIAFAQHGGFYLQARVNAQERLEIRPGSEFWGWGTSGPGVVAVATPRLERIRNRHRGGSRVLLIEGLHPPDRFPLRFASTPLGNQAFDGADRLARFVAASPGIRERMVLRRFPPIAGAGPRPASLEALPGTGIGAAGVLRKATDWMADARMAVVSYPDTPFLEALVVGVPTVGLWCGAFWEWCDEASGILQLLQEARIVFDDPVAAADHVAAVVDDPSGWWEDEGTARARGAFIQRFARPGDWLGAWAEGIARLRTEAAAEARLP